MAEGTVHTGSPAKFLTKPTEEWKKIRKIYAIKQIKICAEYRDMLHRPRLDLSSTPGLRPIGLSPGSWQTSLGLGSMSRYSAQILICITNSTIALILYIHIWAMYEILNMLYYVKHPTWASLTMILSMSKWVNMSKCCRWIPRPPPPPPPTHTHTHAATTKTNTINPSHKSHKASDKHPMALIKLFHWSQMPSNQVDNSMLFICRPLVTRLQYSPSEWMVPAYSALTMMASSCQTWMTSTSRPHSKSLLR